MSTKTSFKRIALVAVAALGMGVLTSVSPASAASTVGNIYFGTTGTITASASVAVGAETAVTITVAHTSDATPAAVTITPTLTKPAASSAGVTDTHLNYTLAAGTNQTAAKQVPNTTTGAIVATSETAAATATVFSPVIKFKPDVPGIYTLTYALTGAGSDDGTPAVRSRTATLTVYAGYSINSTYPNTAFPTQGTNITTGWSATNPGQATVRFTNFSTSTTKKYYVSATGASIASYTEQDSGGDTLSGFTNTNNTNLADGFFFSSASSQIADAVDVLITPNTGATSATVTVKYFDATSGAETIFSVATVTFGAASTLTGGASTSILGAGTTDAAVLTVDDVVSADATAGTQRANVKITLKDQYGNAAYGKTLSATITGPGLIKFDQATQATQGTVRADSLVLTSAQNTAFLGINGDGTGGVATITISVGTTVVGTETVTFFGSAKTLTAKAFETHLSVGPNVDALEVLALDANGNAATFTVTAESSAVGYVGAISNCARATAAEVLLGYTKNAYYCDVQGVSIGKASLTVAKGSLTTNSPVVEFQVTGSVAYKVTLTTDKATYAPGEKVTLKISATDISGNPLGAGSYDLLAADSTASQALTGTAIDGDAAIALSGGYATTTYYAPLVSGPVTFKATLDGTSAALASAIRSSAISVTANVSANTETAALTTLINSLIKKINALSTLVAKIQKKLGVK